MANVLVIGGAGYVGSAACARLLDQGHSVWVLDDLSTGHREFLSRLHLEKRFIHARAGDRKAVSELLKKTPFDCAMHFAAKALVAESVQKPLEYFENNVEQTRVLLETLLDHDVPRFIFSSTCAIFGDPGTSSIDEELPKKPINPYGETKLEAEKLMARLAKERGLRAIALRYFNAAGAEPKLRVGEWHENETHLIPNILKAALSGKAVDVYGTDYPTPDGTCVRDYVHVSDLAAAHVAAMTRLLREPGDHGKFEACNLGSECGYSVKEVIRACEKVTHQKINTVEKPRRSGDPPRLVANSRLAKKELEFEIRFPLEEIVRTAWEWEKNGKHR